MNLCKHTFKYTCFASIIKNVLPVINMIEQKMDIHENNSLIINNCKTTIHNKFTNFKTITVQEAMQYGLFIGVRWHQERIGGRRVGSTSIGGLC